MDTSELHQFFAGYFHEDWALDDSEPRDVIARFASTTRNQPERLARLADSIDDYLSKTPREQLEQALLTELGCYYLPSSTGSSASSWLRDVATQLRAFDAAQRRADE
jgi:hypothetical protein